MLLVRAKVNKETASGANESEGVWIKLGVKVESAEYDNVAAVPCVRGRNVTENEHVKLGAFHTLDLEQKRPASITKVEKMAKGLQLFGMQRALVVHSAGLDEISPLDGSAHVQYTEGMHSNQFQRRLRLQGWAYPHPYDATV